MGENPPLRGSEDPKDLQLLYKIFISPFCCTSSQQRLNNKHHELFHLLHQSKVKWSYQTISPPLSSVLHHVRSPGSILHHLKSSWDFLTGFKWSPARPWKKGEGFSQRHLKHLILHARTAQLNPVTLCSLIAPLGMKCDKRKNKKRANQSDGTKY